MNKRDFAPGPEAQAASDYFNSLSREQRAQLAPLLEEYRRRGALEALGHLEDARRKVRLHVGRIRELQMPGLGAELARLTTRDSQQTGDPS